MRSVFCLFILPVMLLGCSNTSSPGSISQVDSDMQVVLQSEIDDHEVIQEFDLDNCDGKADATRTEHHSSSIDVTISEELAAKIGASAQVISADVQAAIGTALSIGGERGTSIELKAPPNTHMFFQLAWVGKSRIGVVQNVSGLNVPVAFQSFSPDNVRIKSQYDIGCPNILTPTTQNEAQVITQSTPVPPISLIKTCDWESDWQIQPDGNSYVWTGQQPNSNNCGKIGQAGTVLEHMLTGEKVTFVIDVGPQWVGIYADYNMIVEAEGKIRKDNWARNYDNRHLVYGRVVIINDSEQGWSVGRGPDE